MLKKSVGLIAAVALGSSCSSGSDLATTSSSVSVAGQMANAAPSEVEAMSSASTVSIVPLGPSPMAAIESLSVLTRDLSTRIAVAQAEAIRQCMEVAGFDYPFEKPTPPYDDRSTFELYLGPSSMDLVAQHGYDNGYTNSRFPTEPLPGHGNYEAALIGVESTEVIEDPLNPSGPSYTVTSSSGCLGEARASVFGTQESWARYNLLAIAVENHVLAIAQQTLASNTVAESIARWSACMGERGFNYDSPQDAASALWSDRVVELRTAEADVLCKQSSGLLVAWAEAFQSLSASLESEQLGLIEELTVLVEQVDSRLDNP